MQMILSYVMKICDAMRCKIQQFYNILSTYLRLHELTVDRFEPSLSLWSFSSVIYSDWADLSVKGQSSLLTALEFLTSRCRPVKVKSPRSLQVFTTHNKQVETTDGIPLGACNRISDCSIRNNC